MTDKTGILYVVATPIGNLEDMVPRAIKILQSVDLIAAEDTRHSSRLLAHFDIKTPCVAYHDHSDQHRVDQIIARLARGENVALISDAGTPLVSDPGFRLVRATRQAAFNVVPVPGACALVAALSAAGLPSDRFIFEGFLSSKKGARIKQLEALASETRTMIFYEAPHRILSCLQDLHNVLGSDREVVIAREISKTFETIKSATVSELIDWVASDSNQERGEIVLLVHGADIEKDLVEVSPEAERVMSILLKELPIKQASNIAAQLTHVKKKVLYQWAVQMRNDE